MSAETSLNTFVLHPRQQRRAQSSTQAHAVHAGSKLSWYTRTAPLHCILCHRTNLGTAVNCWQKWRQRRDRFARGKCAWSVITGDAANRFSPVFSEIILQLHVIWAILHLLFFYSDSSLHNLVKRTMICFRTATNTWCGAVLLSYLRIWVFLPRLSKTVVVRDYNLHTLSHQKRNLCGYSWLGIYSHELLTDSFSSWRGEA